MISSSPVHSSKTPGSGVAALQHWLTQRMQDSVDAGAVITKLRVIRTSSSDVEKWTASAVTSFASLDRANDSDVRQALQHGFDLVRRDVFGDVKRETLGGAVFSLRLCHAPGGKGQASVGVILHVGRTLFLYLLTSARAGNLAAEDDERRGNAATEIVATAARTMTAVATKHDVAYRPEVHAREHNRIVRSEHHGTLLKVTLTRCRALLYIPHQCDLLVASQAQAFSFGTMMEAGAVESLIRGMNRSEVVLQATGGFYEHIASAPFTHGPLVTTETDPRSGTVLRSENVHRLCVTEDLEHARTTLRLLVTKILEPKPGRPGRRPITDWEAVGNLAAELGLPLRRPQDIKKGLLLAAVSTPTRARAMKTLFSQRWIEGWCTGQFAKDVRVKTDLDLDLDDDVPYVEKDGIRYYKCKINMPLPPGGWGITDLEWDEVLSRRYPDQQQPGFLRAQTTECLPLVGMVRWDDEASSRQFQLTTKSNLYRLRSRPVADAYRGGRLQGWDRSVAYDHHATLRPKALHADVGLAMEKALINLQGCTVPFLVTRPAGAQPGLAESETEASARRLSEAHSDMAAARAQCHGAEDTLNRAQGRCLSAAGDDAEDAQEDLQDAMAGLDRAREARRRARVALKAAQATGPTQGQTPKDESAEPTVNSVDTATAEFCAVALQKCAGLAPGWLNEACAVFLDSWRMTVDTEAGRRHPVRWSCDLVLELLEGGDVIRLPLSGTVLSTANARTTGSATSAEDWAWRFFYHGDSLEKVSLAAGLKPSTSKNSYIYSGLRKWLEPAVPDPDLRTAAVLCPIPSVRRILWAMVTGDTPSLTGIDDAFVEHIRRVYSGQADVTAWSWCRDAPLQARRVSTMLATRPDGTAAMHEVVSALSIGYQDVLRMTRAQKKPGTTAATRPVPYFTKSFVNTSRAEPDDKQLSLRPCPHRDCPDRLRGGRAYCTVILRTPETEAGYGILCPSCRRLPHTSFATIRFPVDYLRPWTGRFGPGSKTWARQHQVSTFLQPGQADPGAGPALHDPGNTPRPSTGSHLPAKEYLSRHLVRQMPLHNKKFLLDELDDDVAADVKAYLNQHGGQLAKRLWPSTGALVIPSGSLSNERITRARDIGVPVITATDFIAAPPETWVRSRPDWVAQPPG